MGGFRVNGCGVTDHFKKVKSLGTHVCPDCKNSAEFFLEEVKQKIDIVFIPTLTLKSQYAVMCKKCRRGSYCSTEWAGYLLRQTEDPGIIFESDAEAKGWSKESGGFGFQESQAATTPLPPLPAPPPLTEAKPIQAAQPQTPPPAQSGKICPKCGSPAETGTLFCPKCRTWMG
ncbi:MAG: zinc-ribbon domain-containing protein [Lachnospiraceae bacterium]|nr:zinc-ribbon domain-containing protein [Lachnospiraceae bacterium]